MKLKYSLLSALAFGMAVVSFSSCDDDTPSDMARAEAKIENQSFTVTGTGASRPDGVASSYRTSFSEDGHTIYIRVPEDHDVKAELNGAKPKFFLSLGASVEPPMTEPQDFSDLDNPVVYTVTSGDGKRIEKYTVTYMLIPPIPIEYGLGYTAGTLGAVKTYVELGYPGTYGTWPGMDTNTIDVKFGDLCASPAFCGKDHIVLFSQRYAWGDDGSNTPANAMEANHDYAFMVYDVATLSPAGKLNLGGINPTDVVFITSDWVGNMVAAVGRKASGKTDFYYWTAPDAAPVHLGTADVSVEIGNHNADAGSYINVAGNITGSAVIAAAAPRDDDGSHYKFKFAGGKLIPGHQIIKTGHSANDKSWFQMISFFGPEDSAPYLVGDCEINPGEDNGQIRIYLNNADGTNRGTMDYHDKAINGWTHDDGEQWWSRSGQWLSRGGGRRPTVHAMVLNGKPYSYFTTGSAWRGRGCMMTQNLDGGIEIEGGEKYPYPHFGWGKITAAKHPNGKDGGIWIAQSFGMMVDWYFDDETQEGWVAVWNERFGLIMFKITCLEL